MILRSMPSNKKGPDIASASVPDTLAGLHVGPEAGLTLVEAHARLKEHGCNEVTERRGHPVLKFLGKFWQVIPARELGFRPRQHYHSIAFPPTDDRSRREHFAGGLNTSMSGTVSRSGTLRISDITTTMPKSAPTMTKSQRTTLATIASM